MITIDVVIPAYNEALVILKTLNEFDRFNNHRNISSPFHFSRIIIVQNGTTDPSIEIVNQNAKKFKSLKITQLCLLKADKGAAQKTGLLWLVNNPPEPVSNLNWVYLCDADLPFDFSEFYYLIQHNYLIHKCDILIGSKGHLESKKNSPEWFRVFFRKILYFMRRFFLDLDIKDSQGSLLIKFTLIKKIMPQLKTSRFILPTELLWKSKNHGSILCEIPVSYIKINHRSSKIRPLQDGFRLILDFFCFYLHVKIFSKS